jgi:hypothetical protein
MNAVAESLRSRMGPLQPLLELALGVLLHLLLVVTAVQAWLAGWPGRYWLIGGVVVASVLSAALGRRVRGAPLVVGCVASAGVLLAALLVHGSSGGGIRIAGLTFEHALAAVVLAALGWTAWRLASLPPARLPRWTRFVPLALVVYAAAHITTGLLRGVALSEVLAGWGPLPFWLTGGYIGAAVMLPAGVLASLGVVIHSALRDRRALARSVGTALLLVVAFLVAGAELTRAQRPNLAAHLLPASMTGGGEDLAAAAVGGNAPGTAGELTGDAAANGPALGAALAPGDHLLAAFEADDLDGIFARVATGVRYEPYRGVLRGAVGTAIARSGNSADQSVLLAELLRRAGYRVRFARGELDEMNVAAIIRGMYPPRVVEPVAESLWPYDPTADAELTARVREHVWVEVFQGDDWLPLDPAFPRAIPGEAYATQRETFEDPPASMHHRVVAVLHEETANGRTRELGRFEGSTVELGMRPISLVVRAIPQVAAEEEAAAGPAGATGMMGGMGAALGGGSAKSEESRGRKRAPAVVGVAYRRQLDVGGTRQSAESTIVRNGDASASLRREWVEFSLSGPGEPARKVERDLYLASDPADVPAGVRRYTINIVPGRVTHDFTRDQAARAAGLLDPKALDARVRRLARVSADSEEAESAAVELARLDDDAGALSGHLMAMRFAAESDSLTRRLADGSRLAVAWSTPRILIVGVETTSGARGALDASVSLDLRLDEVRAYPEPGAPSRVAPLFQAARGLQESVLEGALAAHLTRQEETANTAELMAGARAAGVPLLVLDGNSRDAVAELGAPASCTDRIERAIARGRDVVIPARAIRLAGADRWGWWEIDRATGGLIGVMEDGMHQAMTEHPLSVEKIGLNDKSGAAIGAMVGAVTTTGTLSALLLEHGTVTPQVISELKSFVEAIMCTSCFGGVETSVEAKLSVSVGETCMSEDFFKIGPTIEAKVPFCDSYNDGFKCSAGLILAMLEGKGFDKMTYEMGWSAEVGCDDLDFKRRVEQQRS